MTQKINGTFFKFAGTDKNLVTRGLCQTLGAPGWEESLKLIKDAEENKTIINVDGTIGVPSNGQITYELGIWCYKFDVKIEN